MWIAKPVSALKSDERRSWIFACRAQRERGIDVPLAQALTWARAAGQASAGSFLVFSPEEGVGGIVLAGEIPGGGVRFECINGPLLDWDRPESAKRQLATFAMAVSKLDRRFRSLVLRPRWMEAQAQARLLGLPIQPYSLERAATLRIAVAITDEEQLAGFRPRLRRSLRRTERQLKGVSVTPLAPKDLRIAGWIGRMEEFSFSRGFSVPPQGWFETLLSDPELQKEEGLSFWMAFAEVGPADGHASAIAEHFLCLRDGSDQKNREAHFLFGCERRLPGFSDLSPGALAHMEALRQLRRSGVRYYDLNGYVPGASPDHPYAGVNAFKEQFGGELIQYEIPEFRIE